MTRVTLDRMRLARGFRVAALVRQEVGGGRLGAGFGLWGRKEPVGFLIAGPEGVQGFDAAGRALDAAAVEALAPGAWAAFARGTAEENS